MFKKKYLINIDPVTGVITDQKGKELMNPGDFVGNLPQSPNGSYPAVKFFELEAEDGVILSAAVWNMQNRMAVELSASHERFGVDWSSWSKDSELEKLEWLKSCLNSAGTPVGNYKFGTVSANFDPKSGFSSAWLSYGTKQSAATDSLNCARR